MRSFRWFLIGAGIILLAGVHSDSSVSAAAPPPPPAPTPTLWNYLGIPQGTNRVRDSLTNRRGNRPDAERTDPLRRLADPANLQEDMPKSVKTAAKIKQQEDLAPQKIKAIKYLGTIGCGCYQKEGVREALLDSLDDCTEEVRYEAALALCRAAGTNCDKCGTTCCDAKVMNKLKALADGTDEQCCNKESSERVRDAARQALGACKNKLPATNVTPGIPTPPGTPSGIQPEPLKKKAPESTHIIPAPVERPTPAPRQPVPATIKKPVDLPADAPAGDLLPVPPPPSGASHKEVHKHVVQTAANTAPGAPVRLRLVIGGDEPNDSGAEFREVPNGGSQR